MKNAPGPLQRQRYLMDVRLRKARPAVEHLALPRGGWIKATRESLGMTQAQLARRMGVAQSVAAALERSEQRKAISLSSLERAARAMGCRLIWAVVPERSLDDVLEVRAEEVAARRMKRAAHTMALEGQSPDPEQNAAQRRALARELKESGKLWSDE